MNLAAIAAKAAESTGFQIDAASLLWMVAGAIALFVGLRYFDKKRTSQTIQDLNEAYDGVKKLADTFRDEKDEYRNAVEELRVRLDKAEAKVEALESYISQYGAPEAFHEVREIIMEVAKVSVTTQKLLAETHKAVYELAKRPNVHVDAAGIVTANDQEDPFKSYYDSLKEKKSEDK